MHSAIWPGLAKSAVQTKLHQRPGRNAITEKKKRVILLVFCSFFPSMLLFPFPVPPVIVGKEPTWCKYSPPPAFRKREVCGAVAGGTDNLCTELLDQVPGYWWWAPQTASPLPVLHRKTDPSVTRVTFLWPGLSLSRELEGVWRGLGWRSSCCSYSLPSHFHVKYFSYRK